MNTVEGVLDSVKFAAELNNSVNASILDALEEAGSRINETVYNAASYGAEAIEVASSLKSDIGTAVIGGVENVAKTAGKAILGTIGKVVGGVIEAGSQAVSAFNEGAQAAIDKKYEDE